MTAAQDLEQQGLTADELAHARLVELRAIRVRYLALLDQYAIERMVRVKAAGLSNTEANEVAAMTRQRWSL